MARTHVVQIESFECLFTTRNLVFYTRFSQRLEHVLGGARAAQLSVASANEKRSHLTPPREAVRRLLTIRIKKRVILQLLQFNTKYLNFPL